MKSKSIGSFFLVLTLVAGIATIVPSAFADHMKVDVTMPTGSGSPEQECVATNSCYDPAEVIIDVGGEVTWINADSGVSNFHTATSGQPGDGDAGALFNSDLLQQNGKFSYKFEEAGTYNYFCMVHPWMTGVVTVQEAMAEEEGGTEEGGAMEEQETYASGMSADGSVHVSIESGVPTAGEAMSIKVTFTDADGNIVEHVNYDISAMQDGTEVLSESAAHAMSEPGIHVTDPLSSDSPVDVQVTILGIGFPGEEASWTGPKGDVVSLQVVPEFGTIAALVLAISIVSIIAITAKTRVIPKL